MMPFTAPSSHRGFSLIEVLITMVVIAIGLLTAAGLQLISKKTNYDALQRTQAAQLGQDIAERLRANARNGDAYLTTDATALEQPEPDCAAAEATCSAAEVASYDLWLWGQSLQGVAEQGPDGSNAGGLVDPTGCITGASGRYRITIAWRGITPLPAPASSLPATDPARDPCGADKTVYQDSRGTLRRVLVLDVFVANPASPSL